MRRPTILLMLALVAAFLAAVVVYSALKNREAEMRKARSQSVEVAVAARDIPLGERIAPEAVKLARWPSEGVPKGAFTDVTAVVGSYAIGSFVAGEPIVRKKLATAGSARGVMPLMIPPGMRAMSVPVDEVSDIAGFVKPHTRVDVLVVISGGGPGDKPVAKIVLQNVEVLAIAQQIEKKKDEPEIVKVVTLMVTPHQAEKLGLASREGTLRLAMRNYRDDQVVTTAGSGIAELLELPPAPPPIRAQIAPAAGHKETRHGPSPFSIEILRDGKASETVSFVNGALSASPPSAPGESRADPSAPAGANASAAPRAAKAPGPAAAASAPPAIARSTGAPNGETAYMPTPKTVDLP